MKKKSLVPFILGILLIGACCSIRQIINPNGDHCCPKLCEYDDPNCDPPEKDYKEGQIVALIPEGSELNADGVQSIFVNAVATLKEGGTTFSDIKGNIINSVELIQNSFELQPSCMCNPSLLLYNNDYIFGAETGLVQESNKGNDKEGPQFSKNYIFDEGKQSPPPGFVNQIVPIERKLSNSVSADPLIVAFIDSGVKTGHIPAHMLWPTQGINVLDSNNNVDDVLGHGTIVVETYLRALKELDKKNVHNVQLLPIVALDNCGRGTTFSVSCGLYCADENDADIVNMSLGSENESSTLDLAVSEVTEDRKMKIVASSGNKGYNLNLGIKHFPSQYARPYNVTDPTIPFSHVQQNVFEVGSLCEDFDSYCGATSNKLWGDSNYAQDMFVTGGMGIQNMGDGSVQCEIAGTSYAAPSFTAALSLELQKSQHNGLKDRMQSSSTLIGSYYSYFSNTSNCP